MSNMEQSLKRIATNMDVENDLILIKNENRVPIIQYIVKDADNMEISGEIPFLYGEFEHIITDR